MLLVDVHAHMDYDAFDKDIDEVLKRCEQLGVKAIINNSTHLESIKKTLKLAKKYKIIKPALGLHPTLLKNITPQQLQETLNLIETEKAVAIGEIGLDYHHDKSNKEQQIIVFKKILDIAQKRKLPVIVHSWEATKDTFEVLEPYKDLKVIIHCFEGRKSQIKEGLARGYYFSIPPSVARNPIFPNLIDMVPLNKLLTETDSPFQAPNKQDRNTPENIAIGIKEIAKIKGTTEEDTANIIFQNYQTLF
ncbi:MAG: TatD family hydrolase [Nanoarchaeota archaeon]|nr:TatD family hydrolase [Nanoarchaeota archaeon]